MKKLLLFIKLVVQFNVVCVISLIPLGIVIPPFEESGVASFLLFLMFTILFYATFMSLLTHNELKKKFEKNKMRYFIGIYFGSLVIGILLMSISSNTNINTLFVDIASFSMMLVSILMIFSISVEMFNKFSIFELNNYVKIKNSYYIKILSDNEQYLYKLKAFNIKCDLKRIVLIFLMMLVYVFIMSISSAIHFFNNLGLGMLLLTALLSTACIYIAVEIYMLMIYIIARLNAVVLDVDLFDSESERIQFEKTYYDKLDNVTAVRFKLDQKLSTEKNDSVLLNGKWGVGKTSLIEKFYSRHYYIDVHKYGVGQNNLYAMFKEINKWYNPRNIITNLLNLLSDPDLLKYLVIANSLLFGILAAINKIFNFPTISVFSTISSQMAYLITIILFNILFIQLLPYILLDKDPNSTRFRRLYLEHIVNSVGSRLLIIDNLDRVEYSQLHDFLEVINYLKESNIKILVVADIDELIAIFRSNVRYQEYDDTKIKSYFRKYFNSTVNYLSQAEVYAYKTVEFCRQNDIRATKLSYLKLKHLFEYLPEAFEYRELEQYHEFLLEYYDIYSLDIIFLLYFDMEFNKNSRLKSIPRITNGLGVSYFEEKINLIINDYTNDEELKAYLLCTEETKAYSEAYVYRRDAEAEHCLENTSFLKEQLVPLHEGNNVTFEVVLSSNKLPGQNQFLNNDEKSIVILLKVLNTYIFDSIWINAMQGENFKISKESIHQKVEIYYESNKYSSRVIKLVVYKIIIKALDSTDGNINYEKVWGQFIYEETNIVKFDIDFKTAARTIYTNFKKKSSALKTAIKKSKETVIKMKK